ncbi:MAG: hypothetical protein OYH77_05155 [Pseudomonadota bacterium]|nr:hypothetical protein [Pseudomonadota bacterium]
MKPYFAPCDLPPSFSSTTRLEPLTISRSSLSSLVHFFGGQHQPGRLANTLTVDTLRYNQATRNELLTRLLSEISIDDGMGRNLSRKKFLELRGEGVKIILHESISLSRKEPIYKMHGEELLLTIFAAKPQ